MTADVWAVVRAADLTKKLAAAEERVAELRKMRAAAYADAVNSGMSAAEVAKQLRALLIDTDFDVSRPKLGISHDAITRATNTLDAARQLP